MFSWRIVLFAVLATACSRESSDSTVAADRTKSSKPRPTNTPAPKPADCDGLVAVPCVEQNGCILDQPKAGKYVCRAAKNACERAARHADIIGRESTLASVTEESEKDARSACRAVEGCTIAGGKCMCACHVLGHCDCSCGGGFLTRCVLAADAKLLEGFPPI